MITSNLVKEGYLDIKVPPGSRERKLWKAWQKRWLVSKSVEEPRGLELQIYGCQKPSNSQPLWTVFISAESSKLYRSRSRTHAWTFSIANTVAIVLHLAGESEQVSQSWMYAIRDALWPPSPLVQLEAAFQDVHRVSLIDDDTTCHSDLFGAYGHLYMAGDVILLMSTHSGTLIKQWHLSEVLNVKLERLDEEKASGVFSLSLQSGSLQQLNFYSPTAQSIVQNISATLKMRQEGNAPRSSTLKYDSGIEELSELLNLESGGCDSLSSFDTNVWSLQVPSERLRNLATMSEDFLNCSVNSVFFHQNFSSGSRTSSDASSDYSPPVSPTDPISPNQYGVISPETDRQDFLDHYYCDANTKIRRNSLECTDSEYTLITQHRSSTTSGIYADIMSLPPSKRPSLAETLYEDIEDDDEGFVKLMDEIMEDEYLPPLPPPRNTNKVNDPCVEMFTNTAKRPSTLGLENLSSSISETLSQIQSQSGPNCKTEKKNFPVGLFKPIKGVKRILSNKKTAKSPLSSPTNENSKSSLSSPTNENSKSSLSSPTNENSKSSLSGPTQENSKNTVLSNQNLYSEAKDSANIESHHFKSLLIMRDDTCSPGAECNKNSDELCSSVKNSPAHSSDEYFVPFPELLPMDRTNEHAEVKQKKTVPSDESSSVVIREGQRGKQTRSCDSLLVESLKSKFSCHRDFLEFLQVNKNGDVTHDTLPHACQKMCSLRSISLEQLPCKSAHCRRHSTGYGYKFVSENLRNESLFGQETHLNATYLEESDLKHVLSRRRSSDYCTMSSLVHSDSEQQSETFVTMCDKEQKTRKESLNQEWSNSLQMQITERECLYMDMTRTTK